ncbi:hypothetical protein D0Y65_048952 [Glycine soja]|uniref:Uncharacterized protein n=1 Tax=Glycine soja TaxID=3848 RepID=A0A445FUV1_GLYSO|nr:hypothetical protein D0Y65_048952 [Glycine soja]
MLHVSFSKSNFSFSASLIYVQKKQTVSIFVILPFHHHHCIWTYVETALRFFLVVMIQVLGRGSLCSEVSGKSSSEGWNYKFDYISMGNHGETQNTAQKDMSSIYQEQRLQPCQLSSSIHYGGQDIYSCPKSTQDSGYNSLLYKKDGVEDDLGSNLWQGGPYY